MICKNHKNYKYCEKQLKGEKRYINGKEVCEMCFYHLKRKLKGNQEYCFGDLKNNSFGEIWNSSKRKKIMKKINLLDCPNPCQFDKNIELLYSIKNKITHSNFL